MTKQENLNVFWRALANAVRKRFPKIEFLEDENFGDLHEDVKILWRHADREDWWAFGPGLQWTMEQLAMVAFVVGKGFKFQISEESTPQDWKQSLLAEQPVTEVVHIVNPNCAVCKHPNVVALELILARGANIRRLSDLMGISQRAFRLHRDHCMLERLERLQKTVGFAMDAETFMQGADKLNRTFEKAEELVDKAAEAGEMGAALNFLDRMKEVGVISSEMSGEKKVPEPVGMIGSGGNPGQVNVIVMPTRERKPPKVIDGTVIEEE